MKPWIAIVGLALAACNPPIPETCSDAGSCEACLDLTGCNWTGGTCAEECLQDTDCFGPDNSAADSCPDT